LSDNAGRLAAAGWVWQSGNAGRVMAVIRSGAGCWIATAIAPAPIAETTLMSAMLRRQIERLRNMPASARSRCLDAAARVLGLSIGLGLGVLLKLCGG